MHTKQVIDCINPIMYHKIMDNAENQRDKTTLDSIDVDDGLYTGEGENDKITAPQPVPELAADSSVRFIKTKLPLRIGVRGTIVSAVIFAIMILSGKGLIPHMNWGIFTFLCYAFLVLFSYSVSLVITGGIYYSNYSQTKRKSDKTGKNKYVPFLWAILPTILVVIILSWNGIISWMDWDISMLLAYAIIALLSYSISLIIVEGIYHFNYYLQAKCKSRKTGKNIYAPFLWAVILAIPLAILLYRVILPFIFIMMAY